MKPEHITGAQHLLADTRRGLRLGFWGRHYYRYQREHMLRFLVEYRSDKHPYYCDCVSCAGAYDRYCEVSA